ncbi:uracil-DNA glycosylase [Erythrobacter sp. NAP1]|uniref:uracil-DNA glycosylase family protein n=1 Tax=Erythrobacter sp. NAP1 TaxID=237727 RepID=UPI0000686C46|nr:uracil-DNA glycosylase family protein [Erythrobacter sp. NAP1]EAQ29624.1 uracil-DNA glycosylase [Erythrobacter sp. NAP1]
MSTQRAEALHREIAACTLCAKHLPLGPRPVVQFSPNSRILIVGQAPGTRVHASGIPWDDDSGDRLRGWLGLDKDAFYDPAKVALMPMGFCYPGKAKGGDAPPRKECAPAWHDRILALLPEDRLTLLVGAYAQAAYLPATRKLSMTDRVKRGADFAPFFPLPHPAWRVRMWMAKNPWFEAETLPALRREIAARIA